MLLDKQKRSDREVICLKTINESGEHLLTLINDILDSSKMDAGKMELVPSSVDMSAFLDGVVRIIRARSDQKKLDFTFEKSSDLPEIIIADEVRLRQILLNLLSNAVKFTEAGGVILRAYSLGEISKGFTKCCFEISDTGIDGANMERIFEPFGQIVSPYGRPDGTGLGLPITKRLVGLMDGTLTVTSDPGGGVSLRQFLIFRF